MKFKLICAAAFNLSIFSIGAMAQATPPAIDSASGFYVGGAIGAFGAYGKSTGLQNAPLNQSKNASGNKLFAGYQITDNYGVEVGRLSSATLKRSYVSGGANLTQSGDISSIYAAATGRFPVSEKMALNARLGLAKSKFSGSNVLPAGSSIVGSKSGLLMGVGAEYRFTPKIAATLDYDYLPKTSPNLKSGLLAVGIKVGF